MYQSFVKIGSGCRKIRFGKKERRQKTDRRQKVYSINMVCKVYTTKIGDTNDTLVNRVNKDDQLGWSKTNHLHWIRDFYQI